MGKQIVEKQENTKWGSGFVDQLSKDLKSEFPDMGGFSRSNLFSIKKFYLFYRNEFLIHQQLVNESENSQDFITDNEIDLKFSKLKDNEIVHQVGRQNDDEIVQQLAGQLDIEIVQQLAGQLEVPEIILQCCEIPWIHNVTIIEKIKNFNEVKFYINQTIKNNWSRSVLEYQIETNLYSRQGTAINNFSETLSQVQGDLAKEILKDPYNFEFLTLASEAKEKDLEQNLIQSISKFLLELGKGFAYLGRQFQLKIGNKDYRTDLLFYHTKLKCYIVIELKLKEFEPEFIGKLNFYISAINELVKEPNDQPTIGILLCKTKDNFEVEFALKDINKPIGVSEFKYTQLPENIKQGLPTLEELENELRRIENI